MALGLIMQRQIAKADRFAVARAIQHQHRDAARRQRRNTFEILHLFGDIKAVEK